MDLVGNGFKWYRFCIVISFINVMTETVRHGLTKLFQKLSLQGISIVLKVETVVFEKTTTLSIFQRLWLWPVRIVTNKQKSTSWKTSDKLTR